MTPAEAGGKASGPYDITGGTEEYRLDFAHRTSRYFPNAYHRRALGKDQALALRETGRKNERPANGLTGSAADGISS
jgi:hypothetical protein